jgi:hypothetical protein
MKDEFKLVEQLQKEIYDNRQLITKLRDDVQKEES